MIPAIANGHRTGESTFKTRPKPHTNAQRIATSSAIASAVTDAQTIRACLSVGAGKLIREQQGRARCPYRAPVLRKAVDTGSLSRNPESFRGKAERAGVSA